MSAGERHVLALNCGSSSIKAAQFRVGPTGLERTLTVSVRGIGRAAVLEIVDSEGTREEPRPVAGPKDALRIAVDALQLEVRRPDAVGHRIVHGGAARSEPALIDRRTLDDLHGLAPLAPLHQELGLAGVALIDALLPGVAQVACFDTAFHRTMPPVAQRLPLPTALHDAGVRRYGFHGLSCEHVVHTLGVEALDRAIVAHLGSGSSLTALRHGRSVDTTMSFTPTGGVPMATRTGDIDPSVLVYLLLQHGYDPARLQHLIEHESGLVGVSGSSGDMQALLARRPDDPAAALAVELFCRDVAKQIGSLAAVLGGVAAVVFTGGVGEHADAIRAAICERLAHLGIELDHARNARGEPVVSSSASTCAVHVVAADEEAVIGRHTAALVFGGPA